MSVTFWACSGITTHCFYFPPPVVIEVLCNVVFEFLFSVFVFLYKTNHSPRATAWEVEDTTGRKQGGPSKMGLFLKIALDGRCYVKRTEYGFEVCKKKTTFTHVVLHCCYQTALLPRLWMLLLVLLGQTQKMSVVYSLSANPFTK